MTSTAKKLYIKKKLHELIQYIQNSGLEEEKVILKRLSYIYDSMNIGVKLVK